MFFEDFPFAYSLDELLRRPDASQSPPTVPRGSLVSQIKARRRLAAVNAKLHALAEVFDRQIRCELFPAISNYVAEAKQIDLAALSAEQLVECWRKREKQVLDVFGPQLFMPSLIGAMAIADLRTFLAENFWDEDANALAHLISSGGEADRTVVANAELHEVAKGGRSLDAWLADHGHRAANEFDLAVLRMARAAAGRVRNGRLPDDR